jgi:hypothetical protein
MRRRHILLLLCLGAMVVQASTFMASAADFTCQVYGGSFALDDTDFKAMADSTSITKETFASIKPDPHARICATRKLWRLIKDGTADYCDFTLHYKNFNPPPWTIDETNDACFIVRDSTRQALAYVLLRGRARSALGGQACSPATRPVAWL